MTNETWGHVREELRKVVGTNNFSAWIEPIAFDRLDERTAHFFVPTSFIGSWVSNNFGDLILRHLASHGVGADRVEFKVAPRTAMAASANASRQAVSQPAQPVPSPAPQPVREVEPISAAPATAYDAPSQHAPAAQPAVIREPNPTQSERARPGAATSPELPGSNLNPALTFENFVVGKPNELAHAAARRVAETLDVTFNPLFLYGGVGLGKTHLMHAIAWELSGRFPDAKILYLSAEQFMHRFVRALREQDTFNFKETFRSVDILMVDDVQFIAGKTSTQQEFFHTFNALVEMGKQIVISGDRAPVDMENLDNRIASRLQCGLVVDIHPTDYELRLGVLQHKAERLSARYPHVRFAPGVLEYLAQKISANVRVLEGALTRLFAFADLVRREVTIDVAKECLTDVLRATDKKVTMDEVIKKTCEYYKIRQVDIISQNRQRAIARPRQMAMYLCKKLTQRSLPEIGRKFGDRDHTTILYGVRKIEELMQIDNQIAEDAELLRRTLEE